MFISVRPAVKLEQSFYDSYWANPDSKKDSADSAEIFQIEEYHRKEMVVA